MMVALWMTCFGMDFPPVIARHVRKVEEIGLCDFAHKECRFPQEQVQKRRGQWLTSTGCARNRRKNARLRRALKRWKFRIWTVTARQHRGSALDGRAPKLPLPALDGRQRDHGVALAFGLCAIARSKLPPSGSVTVPTPSIWRTP
ncbi:UNVERIFIED_ORG: hypothetical protein J2W38_007110 [Variovorax paradoxus]|nr:hypothetical protein [Variovorax paradoxus]